MLPVPKPREDESKQEYIARCIKTLHETDPERPADQIQAICYTSWREAQLEQPFRVRLGSEETEMLLPVTAEGTLDVSDIWLADEPPTSKETFTAKAIYQHHWFRGKAKPIRVGPSVEYWHLKIDWRPGSKLLAWTLREDITTAEQSSCVFEWADRSWWEKGKDKIEEIKPGEPGNPTKDTPAFIEIVDRGTVRVYEMNDMFVKLDIRMKKLKGHFLIVRRDPHMNLWTIRKEEKGPEVEK